LSAPVSHLVETKSVVTFFPAFISFKIVIRYRKMRMQSVQCDSGASTCRCSVDVTHTGLLLVDT